MKKETVEIKSKGQVLGTFDYEYPENMKEAIKVDGEDDVFKLYLAKRKIAFMDTRRRELTGGGGLPKNLREALKKMDPKELAALLAQAGVDVDVA